MIARVLFVRKPWTLFNMAHSFNPPASSFSTPSKNTCHIWFAIFDAYFFTTNLF
jgi:hypothetical protein